MTKTILVTLLATALAVAPAPLTYAHADEQPTATTQNSVYAATYAPTPEKTITVQNAAYKRGDVAALKVQIALLLVNPKDAAARAEILKLAPTNKSIPVVARAISQLKAEAVKELKAAGNNKVLRQQANQEIRRLNTLSKELKQAIMNHDKQVKKLAAKAKKAATAAKHATVKAKQEATAAAAKHAAFKAKQEAIAAEHAAVKAKQEAIAAEHAAVKAKQARK